MLVARRRALLGLGIGRNSGSSRSRDPAPRHSPPPGAAGFLNRLAHAPRREQCRVLRRPPKLSQKLWELCWPMAGPGRLRWQICAAAAINCWAKDGFEAADSSRPMSPPVNKVRCRNVRRLALIFHIRSTAELQRRRMRGNDYIEYRTAVMRDSDTQGNNSWARFTSVEPPHCIERNLLDRDAGGSGATPRALHGNVEGDLILPQLRQIWHDLCC